MSTDTHTCRFVFAMMQFAGANVKEKEVRVELPPDATFFSNPLFFKSVKGLFTDFHCAADDAIFPHPFLCQ